MPQSISGDSITPKPLAVEEPKENFPHKELARLHEEVNRLRGRCRALKFHIHQNNRAHLEKNYRIQTLQIDNNNKQAIINSQEQLISALHAQLESVKK